MRILVYDSPDRQLDVLRQSLGTAGHAVEYCPIGSSDTDRIIDTEQIQVVVTESRPITREFISQLPALKLVIRAGIGVDLIDLGAARDHAVAVANVPDYCVEEVADHSALLILGVVRRFGESLAQVKNWGGYLPAGAGRMRNMTIGLIGAGAIGRGVARRMSGFGSRILAYDPWLSSQPEEIHELVGLEELAERADVISVHCPLTAETKGILNGGLFASRKRGLYIVNTARGGIVAADLFGYLSGRDVLLGVGVDVLADEPYADISALTRTTNNALITPHVGWYSEAAIYELNHEIARCIDEFENDGHVYHEVRY